MTSNRKNPILTAAALALALLARPAPAQAPAAAEARLAGIWAGELVVQKYLSLRLSFTIVASEGSLAATMDSLDQGVKGIPVASVGFDGSRVELAMPAFAALYSGTLAADGSRIDGYWEQGGMKLPLSLERKSAPPTVDRPQEPLPPFPYASIDLEFRNESAGIELAGTLTVPAGKGPFPALVLVSGSGAQNRDEELLGHKPFLVLADYLARRGIASLRYDDRGVGGSGGDPSAATSLDFADDAEAAFEALAARPEVDPALVGIAGHSEGGLIAPIVASRNAKVAFIVLLAGPGLRGDRIILLQGALIARASGEREEAIAEAARVNGALYAIAASGLDAEAARAAMKEAYLAWLDSSASLSAAEKAAAREEADRAVSSLASPWFRTFLALDPEPYLSRLGIPVLALNGSKDLQVPARESLSAIERAIGPAGDPRNRYVELPGLNHLFQTAGTGLPEEYGKIAETMSPEAMRLVGDWIDGLSGR